MDALDYVEAQAQRLTTFRLETMELLNKRAHTLATLQLGGGGALAAFGVALLDKPRLHWAAVGVLVAAALWFVLAAWTTRNCLVTEELYPPGNEPQTLLQYTHDLPALRRSELLSVQDRQVLWRKRNEALSLALDKAYMATALTPLPACAAAWVVFWLARGALV